jgi:hypothetical protein
VGRDDDDRLSRLVDDSTHPVDFGISNEMWERGRHPPPQNPHDLRTAEGNRLMRYLSAVVAILAIVILVLILLRLT